jgi:2,3-dihydroxy-p-cumate/2,3-dihydroxybenzoate 3,4-dioxygenase
MAESASSCKLDATLTSSSIRYSRLGYVALRVTNLTASVRFYVDLVGLSLARVDDRCAWLRCSDQPYDILVEQGKNAGLSRVGFELEDASGLANAFARTASQGLDPQWLTVDAFQQPGVASAFRFRNPHTGLELDFYTSQGDVGPAYQPTVTEITRLGHVVLNVRNFADAHRFWIDALGFAVSDHVPSRIAFLRCFPNPLHHSLALVASAVDGLNHVNFMVSNIDDVGRAMNRMKRYGVPIVFGPGRHLPSGSIFLYFLDPDGMTLEYSFGMEEITEFGGRPPRELAMKPEVLDTWGSIPDPRFGKTGGIVTDHG